MIDGIMEDITNSGYVKMVLGNMLPVIIISSRWQIVVWFMPNLVPIFKLRANLFFFLLLFLIFLRFCKTFYRDFRMEGYN